MKPRPPFEITPTILGLVAKIERLLGQVETTAATRPEPKLRRQNRIRTIKDSLAIEGNTLSLEQVTALFENKRVIGSKREILEVKNAIRAYELAPKWLPGNEANFRQAHATLMKDLIPRPGSYRASAVGIIKGNKVAHVAPKSDRVPSLMADLFRYLNHAKDHLSPLVLSAVAHYEIEFIHPFEDGNGRVGRLWQHVILRRYHPTFEIVPFESLIKERQVAYYKALEDSDKAGNSTEFIRFTLKILAQALCELISQSPSRRLTSLERLEQAKGVFTSKWFSRKKYFDLFPSISAPTASRDLARATDAGLLTRREKLNKTVYRFKG